MYQHKSIAQAKLKGAVRVAISREKELLQAATDSIKHSKNLLQYKKGILEYIKLFKKVAQGRIIYEYTSPKRSSWHHNTEFLSFAREFTSVEGHPEVGNQTSMLLQTFNTRRLLKGHRDGHQRLIPLIFVQEHFMLRCLQRLGSETLGDVGRSFYSVIEWLLTSNVPLKHIPQDCYFVLRDYIIVGTQIPHSQGLLFKTVLTYEKMEQKGNEEQRAFFSEAVQTVKSNGDLHGVLVDEHGKVVRSIPKCEHTPLAGIDIEKSNWLAPLDYEQEEKTDVSA